MKRLHGVRLLLLALLISLVPASSNAGVLISVGFAPPPMPVYEQPICPEPGLMWVPGYWAYGDYGYYWVPGAWVPAPYVGALWTPGYWGWNSGFYMWNPGYWGNYVGYYGGVNYGYGYFGIGFVGGHWRDRNFEYNAAVMRINERRIHHFYRDRNVVDRYTVDRGSRVSYNGGRGGIRYRPSAAERVAMREQHTARTNFQSQHEMRYRDNRNAYARFNGGRPQNVVERQPLQGQTRQAPGNMMQNRQGNSVNRNARNLGNETPNRNQQQVRPNYQNPTPNVRQIPNVRNDHQMPQQRPQSQYQPQRDQRQLYQPQNQQRPQPQYRQRESGPQPQYRQPQQHAQPQYRQSQPGPQPQYRQPQNRPAPQVQERRSAPRPAPEARPAPRQQHQTRPEPKGGPR
ncbi:MAG TPA: hypothetical protein VMV57_14815 [Terracidiphilus sp.]|nr:hypothetical protein [Terracidiphilus sp.]